MAYYPQYPGYQPYYSQPVPDQLAQLRQNQMQQPMIQQPVPPMQPQMIQQAGPQSNGMIWVGSKQDADAYLVAPGSAVALWDSNESVVYLRQADATGKPSTKVYDLVERTDTPAQKQAPEIDMSKYMTVDKAEEMINQIVSDMLAERLKRPSRLVKTKEDTTDG